MFRKLWTIITNSEKGNSEKYHEYEGLGILKMFVTSSIPEIFMNFQIVLETWENVCGFK